MAETTEARQDISTNVKPPPAQFLPTFRGDEKSSGTLWCSWNPDTPEKKSKLARILNSRNEYLNDHTGVIIPVANVVIRKSDRVENESGELITVDRMILITPDWTAYETASPYAIEAMRNICHLFHLPPYDPPLLVTAVKFPTANGRKYLSILVEDNPFNPTKSQNRREK